MKRKKLVAVLIVTIMCIVLAFAVYEVVSHLGYESNYAILDLYRGAA